MINLEAVGAGNYAMPVLKVRRAIKNTVVEDDVPVCALYDYTRA